MGTYFRPRRAAELIHQNKVLNCWKDYAKRNNRTINNWMTPTALANNISSLNSVPWQPIPASAALQTIRNGNLIRHSTQTSNDVKRKEFFGVRPTQLNSQALAPNVTLFQSLNYSNYFNETGERTLQALRRPIAPVHEMT